MQFLLIVVISLVVLGIIAAIASYGSTDDPIVQKEGDCASCTSKEDCKLKDLKEEIIKKQEARGKKQEARGKKQEVRGVRSSLP